MTTTATSLPRNEQRANCQPATRAKAKRLVVETINQQAAFVIGDIDLHMVTFRDLRCDCDAASFGRRCSHVLAAIRERAVLHGFTHTAFLSSMDHADTYAKMQRGLGRKAVSHSAGRYHWCEFSTTDAVDLPPDSDVLEPTPDEQLAARMATGEAALAKAGVVRVPAKTMAARQSAADALFG